MQEIIGCHDENGHTRVVLCFLYHQGNQSVCHAGGSEYKMGSLASTNNKSLSPPLEPLFKWFKFKM